MSSQRQWVVSAIAKIQADFQRSADTHLIKLDLPQLSGIDIYLKDESTHPTGSLKHRLARSLFLYALCNGKIKENTVVVEASSGSTAISEAYFSRLLGLRFIAVMAKSTSIQKINEIKRYGGECFLVDSTDLIYAESERLTKELNGYYMDQFTNAERATDWRGNNNIADSIFEQMLNEPYPIPTHIVMSAGTGGTSATIGRYIRYHQLTTELTVVDPENSVFYDYFFSNNKDLISQKSSLIEGIGRPRVEPSFIASVIDNMMKVDNKDSIAAMQWLAELLGRKVGASTGTNMVGVLKLAKQMHEKGQKGSIVTLLCDRGERYANSYYDAQWVMDNIGEISQQQKILLTI
ncbi:PLP-dependent cysteine synthase family protein [Psychromonas sp. RZ22]|uniref:PLP-dependent cysteine synthase family protein n=1 Tax=Psychromonas algarum TaxID=2555643 RepID=UPI001067BBEF|nr:PLP-dependent cysteine synthase family protein [Psychromonas sp. RZ22]TEW53731.1 PLP-dependent cysteine synthase family protein [Psychromonas sp. RZ22]